jgi:hypothetical protein
MLRAVLLSRPKPPQAGAGGQPLQGHSSQPQLSTKVSGPPLAAASTPGRRAESTASACEIHPLKIQKSLITFIFPSRNGPDETYQTVEQALRLNTGMGFVPWEFERGIRSWLLPSLCRVDGDRKARGVEAGEPDRDLYLHGYMLSLFPVVCGFLLVGELQAAGVASYNAGVDAVGTFNEVHLLRDHLRGWHGRVVVVAFYLGNDFRDNYGDSLVPEPSSAAAMRPMRGRMDEGLRTICKALFTCNWLYHQVYLGLIEGESRDPMKSYALAQMEMLAKGRAAASDIAVAHTRQAFAELARVAAI